MFGTWRIKNWLIERKYKKKQRAAREAVAAFPKISRFEAHGLPNELIVTLTSYPPRFPFLENTLKSLLDQTMRPDRIMVWVAEKDISILPYGVLNLMKFGIEFATCPDYRSYKKIVPALLKYPDAYIVTADDDLYYDHNWLEELVETGKKFPNDIIAHRAHMAIIGEDGQLLPYREWDYESQETSSLSEKRVLFPTGGAGTLYPPRSLPSLTTDHNIFMSLCPTADDVWLFWMAKMNCYVHRKVKRTFDLIPWDGTEVDSLYHSNVFESQNDIQIRAMEDYFGKLISLPSTGVDSLRLNSSIFLSS